MKFFRMFQSVIGLPCRAFLSNYSMLVLMGFVIVLGACKDHARTQTAAVTGAGNPAAKQTSDYQVAVYYWPNYHVDPRNEAKLGKGWTEWELVKAGKVKYPGQDQPHVPLWGYRDESDPKEMSRSIDAMADHGITAIIFDWYRYNDGSFLDDCLHKGFLQAPNRNRIQFALMWANHNFIDIFPRKSDHPRLWYPGAVTRPTFDRVTGEAIRDFFSQPNYWKIDGKPYFSIYELHTMIKGLGGLKQTHDALESFRARTKAAGFPGLHLDIVGWGLTQAMVLVKGQPVAGVDPSRTIQTDADLLAYLNADSVNWYTWTHVSSPGEPTETYDHWGARSTPLWSEWQNDVHIPFYPNVSVGWDGSPRNYAGGIIVDNSPALFRKYLEQAKSYLDQQPPDRRILTVNAWNEWVEGSYLEPDKRSGLGYLEAIQQVFGSGSQGGNLRAASGQ